LCRRRPSYPLEQAFMMQADSVAAAARKLMSEIASQAIEEEQAT
jgi:hypothetical protein